MNLAILDGKIENDLRFTFNKYSLLSLFGKF